MTYTHISRLNLVVPWGFPSQRQQSLSPVLFLIMNQIQGICLSLCLANVSFPFHFFFLIPSYFLETPLQKFWIMKLISKYILAHTVSYFPCPIFLFSFPFFKILLSFAQTQRKGKEKCKSLCYSYNWLIQLLCTK